MERDLVGEGTIMVTLIPKVVKCLVVITMLTTKEPKIDLPTFYDKKNVKEYLDWEMKVEKLFKCHQVNKEIKVSIATLSFP